MRFWTLALLCAAAGLGVGCENAGIEESRREVVTTTKPPKFEDELDMLALRPAYSKIRPGGEQALTLHAWVNGGDAQDVTSEAWTSDNSGVASIDASGRVTAVAVGETLIRARYRGEEALARIVVEAAPPEPEEPPVGEIPNDPDPVPEDPPPSNDPPPDDDPPPEEDPCSTPPPSPEAPFADRVVSHITGSGGGFHEDDLPSIVLGPPKGAGAYTGTLDVFSLGVGGEIVLEFTDYLAVDCEGDDIIVFENAFQVGTNPDVTFAEPGVVSVSEDGMTWIDFPCNLAAAPYAGCAGVHPTLANSDTNDIDPTDLETAGGDAFDLADVGLKKIRFIKIQDSGLGLGPIGPGTRGFDLDAVSIVNGTLP